AIRLMAAAGSRTGGPQSGEPMTITRRHALVAAGAAITLIAAVAAAVFAKRPLRPTILLPRFCSLHPTRIRVGGHNLSLRPHSLPLTVTPLDRVPIDKIKLPDGLKAEVWSHGHPAARTMVRGAKGTVFMGTRQIGRVYAIIDKDGKREPRVLLQGLTQ